MTIQENLDKLKSTKANIRQSIINKGVDIELNEPFDSYPGKIDMIETSSKISLRSSGLSFGGINLSKYLEGRENLQDYFIFDAIPDYMFSNARVDWNDTGTFVLDLGALSNRYLDNTFECIEQRDWGASIKVLLKGISPIKLGNSTFRNAKYITEIESTTGFDVISLSSTFYGCGISKIPNGIDWSKVRNAEEVFTETNIVEIPDITFNSLYNFFNFAGGQKLEKIGNITINELTGSQIYLVSNVPNLKSIGLFKVNSTTHPDAYIDVTLNCPTELAGIEAPCDIFIYSWDNILSDQSLENIITHLIQLGEGINHNLYLSQQSYVKLTEDQKTRATAKGWSIMAN